MIDAPETRAAALAPLAERVRTDATAVRLPEGGSRWRRTQPLTPARLLEHVAGAGLPRGVCPIREGESTTRVAVLDFDSHQGETPWGAMCVIAGRVFDALALAWGCEPLAFRSTGGRGVHLILVWDAPQDAYSVRQWLMEDVLHPIGLRNGDGGVGEGQVEVFPKQSHVAKGGLGSQFILPLAGRSEWLVFEDLSCALMPASRPLTAQDWVSSPAVPVRERPVREAVEATEAAGGRGVHLQALRAPLEHLVGVHALTGVQQSRGDWRNTVFGIHAAGVLDDDLPGAEALAEWFCRETPGWDEAEFEKLWGSCKPAPGGVGPGSVKFLAGAAGWRDPERAPDPEAFGHVEGQASSAAQEMREPPFRRDKQGAIEPTLTNAVLAVQRDDLTGIRVGQDDFRAEMMWAPGGSTQWQRMEDHHIGRIRLRLEALGFKSLGKDLARDAAVVVSDDNRFDTAIQWLTGLERSVRWDGVRRVDGFMRNYLGTENTPYARAVSRYLWTALAGRVMEPGCKADMAPVLVGAPGVRKSSLLEAIPPSMEQFAELDFSEDETNTVRKLRGCLVGELAELSGLKSRAREHILKFMSRRIENWVPKFREFATQFPRRCVFVGTSNPSDLIEDDAVARRLLPIEVTRADVDAVVRDRDQLWLEGLAMWRAGGIAWQEAEELARGEHAKFTVDDPWQDNIRAWLQAEEATHKASGSREEMQVRIPDMMSGGLGIQVRDKDRSAQMRISAILKRAGYVRRGGGDRYWVKPLK